MRETDTETTNKETTMETDRLMEIGTCGGCGLVATEVLKILGRGVPVLWYRDGSATHAAVKIENQLIHLGSRENGYTEVSEEELARACREDFNARDFEDEEIKEVARAISADFFSA